MSEHKGGGQWVGSGREEIRELCGALIIQGFVTHGQVFCCCCCCFLYKCNKKPLENSEQKSDMGRVDSTERGMSVGKRGHGCCMVIGGRVAPAVARKRVQKEISGTDGRMC